MKADKAFERGGIFVVKVQWFHESVAKWKRQPENNHLMPRRYRRSEEKVMGPDVEKDSGITSTERLSTSAYIHETEEVKVSEPDGAGENGTDSRASARNNSKNPIAEDDSVQEQVAPDWPIPQENGPMELHIDWEAIDKEVDDALASDDEESVAESEARNGHSRWACATLKNQKSLFRTDIYYRDMEDIVPVTRGVKRRRSETSTPTTPSRLRYSVAAPQDKTGDSPPEKRQKISETSGVASIATLDKGDPSSQAQDHQETANEAEAREEDDDDDFLAREMARGDTDDSDQSDSS